MQLAVLFLAGLSLFFTGIHGVKSKLQQLSSRRFRLLLSKVTGRSVLASVTGIAFGAVTQSASAVAFILAGMVATGLISLRRALPVVAASNVGTALLVFLAAFDFRLAVLALIGITGLMITFKVAHRLEAALGALFAIGILFLGLDMMKQAFAPLPRFDWFIAMAAFLKSWAWAPFLLGAGLRMVIQSSSAIGVIAIALQGSGLFTEYQSILLVCGAGPGVALSSVLLSQNLEGPPRQIVLFQGLINLLSGCVVGGLFFLSENSGHTFLFQFIDAAAWDNAGRIAWAFFLNMLGCFLAGLLLAPYVSSLLGRLAPASEEQDLSRPAFLHDEALQVPETAVILVDKEQQRLFSLAQRAMDAIRDETPAGDVLNAAALQGASQALGSEISVFLQEMIGGDLAGEVASLVLLSERRQENLVALTETVYEFVRVRKECAAEEKLDPLFERMTESLYLILLTAQDAWLSRDRIDLDFLLTLASDRGEAMERIRQTYQTVEIGQNSALFHVTSLFERIVWIVRQLGLSLQRERA